MAGTEAFIRHMDDFDLSRVQELRSVVSWSADPRAFDLLRGMREARWAVAELRDGSLAGMVGAVPLGRVGILCHLAVHDGHRGFGLGARLTSWAVAYLRSRGAAGVRLYSTRQAEKIYHAAGFRATTPRTVYRLEEARHSPRTHDGRHDIDVLTTGDLPEVYGADYWSYGADRSALILATLRQQSCEGLVARDSAGGLKGYLIRSATPHAATIGPFMAANLDVARHLIARSLESCVTHVEVTVTGPDEAAAHDLFEEFGFEGRKDRLQMELGAMPVTPAGSLEHYGTTPYLAT